MPVRSTLIDKLLFMHPIEGKSLQTEWMFNGLSHQMNQKNA